MWPIIKVVVVFLLIIIMLRRRQSLEVTMMAASASLGLLFGMKATALAHQLVLTLITPATLSLILALILFMIMESIMPAGHSRHPAGVPAEPLTG